MTKVDFLLPQETQTILDNTKSVSDRLKILLLHDAMMRVSEMTNLDWKDIDFRRRIITVKSLKKKDKGSERQIPMSDRIYDEFAEYVKEKGKERKGLVFATSNGTAPSRQSMNYLLRKTEKKTPEIQGKLHPHLFRHSGATNMRANGATIEDIRDMLGHERVETSLIYAHADPERIRQIINTATPKKTFFERLKERIFPVKKRKVQIITATTEIIGRETEIKKIEQLLSKEISIILTGKIGIGKTHILNNLKFGKPVLEIDDCKDFKKSIANILLHLFTGDKEAVAQLIFDKSDRSEIERKMSKHSLINICDLLREVTQPKEYILKIGDIDQITPSVVKALENLKEHFVIITSARNIKMENTSFAWDFEKVEIKELKREDSLRLFHRLTDTFEIQEIEFVRNKVYDTSEGNPRAIVELAQRITKEDFINARNVEEICNSYLGRVVKEIDMSLPFLLLFIIAFAILKVRGREMGEEGWRTISGGIMIILLFARYFFSKTRRRTI
jgi:integrase/recombinase XerD